MLPPDPTSRVGRPSRTTHPITGIHSTKDHDHEHPEERTDKRPTHRPEMHQPTHQPPSLANPRRTRPRQERKVLRRLRLHLQPGKTELSTGRPRPALARRTPPKAATASGQSPLRRPLPTRPRTPTELRRHTLHPLRPRLRQRSPRMPNTRKVSRELAGRGDLRDPQRQQDVPSAQVATNGKSTHTAIAPTGNAR